MKYVLWDWDNTIAPDYYKLYDAKGKKYTSIDNLFTTIFCKHYLIPKSILLEILKDPNSYIVTMRPKVSTFFVKINIILRFYKELSLFEKIRILFGNKILSSNLYYFFIEETWQTFKQFLKQKGYKNYSMWKKHFWKHYTGHKHIKDSEIFYVDQDIRN